MTGRKSREEATDVKIKYKSNQVGGGSPGLLLAAAPKPSPQQSLLRDGLRSRGGKAGLCTRTTNGDHNHKHHPTFACTDHTHTSSH